MNGKPVFEVPSKTVINMDSGFKAKLLSTGPTFSAGMACPYICKFCYVPAVLGKQKPWLEKNGVTGEHEEIVIRRKDALAIAEKQLNALPVSESRHPHMIYASPHTDVAANMELVEETIKICELILDWTEWDIRLLSKSNLLPKIAIELKNHHRFYNLGLAKSRVIFGVSTGTLDNNVAKAFECGTPLVSKRIESLHWLQDNGFRTYGMICPSLPVLVHGHLKKDALYLQQAREITNAIRHQRCEHVWAEVINLRGKSFTNTVDALGNAGFKELAAELERVSGDRQAWEEYARLTFEAYKEIVSPNKLRFMQYTRPATREWWESETGNGAVICN